MKAEHLKVPVEMAQFSFREGKYRQVASYLASHFIYSGKVRTCDKPVQKIADIMNRSEPTVYRYFRWLLSRDWMGKDTANGWYFFRGLDRVHEIENWKFGRAAIMYPKDLQTIKAFFSGAVLASLAKTGKGERTERLSRGSEQSASPISLSVLAATLQVSESTAYRLRKLADKYNYIENHPNLIEITNWTPEDLKHLNDQDLHKIPVKLLGYPDGRISSIDRIRYKKNKLFLQEPNLIKPQIQLKVRAGLLDTAPYRGTNVSQ